MLKTPTKPYTKLIFTACDRKYFHRHAETFIAALDINSPGQLLILCVFGANKDIKAKLNTISARAKSTEIILHEADDCPGSYTEKQKRGYYVTQRFIEFERVFNHYGIDAIFTDIDNLVLKDLHLLSNHYKDADIAIHTRFHRKLESRKVLGALIWFRHTRNTSRLLNRFNKSFDKQAWYQDQALLYRNFIQMPLLKLAHLDKRYVDWNFDEVSVIWCAKGERKEENQTFVDKEQELLNQFRQEKMVAILAPRVDLGFKEDTSTKEKVMKKRLADPVRANWHYFPKMLRDAVNQQALENLTHGGWHSAYPRYEKEPTVRRIRHQPTFTNNRNSTNTSSEQETTVGWINKTPSTKQNNNQPKPSFAEIITLPLHAITPKYIASLPHDRIYVPHKNSRQIQDKRCRFYMQELFPFFFTLDDKGWAANASYYGDQSLLKETDTKQAEALIEEIKNKRLTKITQKPSDVEDMVFDVFFPLQIPHDETIKCHSDYDFEEVLDAVIHWATDTKTQVLIKIHPMSSISLKTRLLTRSNDYCKFVAKGHIHDYIEKAKAVFVINSGVGFEALMLDRPVVTFGRAIYDLVTHKATPDQASIQAAYNRAIHNDIESRHKFLFIQNHLFDKGCLINQEQFKLPLTNTQSIDYVNTYLDELDRMWRQQPVQWVDLQKISVQNPKLSKKLVTWITGLKSLLLIRHPGESQDPVKNDWMPDQVRHDNSGTTDTPYRHPGEGYDPVENDWMPDQVQHDNTEITDMPHRHPGEGRRSSAGTHRLRTKGWNPERNQELKQVGANSFAQKYLPKQLDLNIFTNKSIALVGNGRSILNHDWGKEIDDHDIVIRMNLGYPYLSKKDDQGNPLAPADWIEEIFIDRKTKPAEKHYLVSPEAPEDILQQYTNIPSIGKKTTIWSFATTDRRRQKTFSKAFKNTIQLWPHPSLWNLRFKLWSSTFRPSFIYQKKLRKVFSIHPSTGMILFEMLKDLPIQELDLYGFDFFTSGHIGRKNKMKRFPHNPAIEAKYIKEVAKNNRRIIIKNSDT